MITMCKYVPSYVAKEGVRNIPFVGKVAEVAGCCFFDRGDKNQKRGMLNVINERQALAEKSDYPPLIMNCEGGTTNGRYLIKFKKGAFCGMKSV